MILQFQNTMHPIQENTAAIKSLADIENTRHQQQQQLLNSQTEAIKSQITNNFNGQRIKLETLANDLKRKDEILKTQAQEFKNFKDAQANLIKENIKSNFDPMIRKMEMQALDI